MLNSRIKVTTDERTILVVVPARGGSKGVPLKNLRKVGGLSLVEHVGGVVQQLEYVDRAVVSTDHEEIAEAAERSGLDAPFRRPEKLSGDLVGDRDVLTHALQATEEVDDRRYDIVVMLQPTSPLRRPEHVTAAVEKLVGSGYDAVWTVSETDTKFHPLKQLVIDEAGDLRYYDPQGADIIARQQLGRVFHRNGVAYAITRRCLLEHRSIKGERTGAVVIDGPVVNIDSEEELERAEALFGSQRDHGLSG